MSYGGAYRVILSELAAVRLDPALVCVEAGIDPRALDDEQVPFGAQELTHALERAEAMAADPLLGLHIAERASGRGVLAYLARAQRTVGEALTAFARHSSERWGPGAGVRVEHRGLGAAVVFDVGAAASRHAIEYVVARTAIALRRSGTPAREAWFGHAPGGPIREYERVLRSPVRFRRGANGLTLRSTDLARPLTTANPDVAKLLAKALVTRPERGVRTVSARLAAAVRDALARGASLEREVLARALGMSGKTLSRRLAVERHTFSDLVDAERRSLAERLVLEATLDLGEVAARAGFADAAALGKAFRRWFGASPTAYRARRSGG